MAVITPVRWRPAGAVHVDRLIGRVAHKLEELRDLRRRGRYARRHWNPIELHASSLDTGRFDRHAVRLQVDDRCDAEGFQRGIVAL
jgi:hypothetical protein